ncbi:histidine phosphatase superfamily, partial [Catenaria anguillulae PL171]
MAIHTSLPPVPQGTSVRLILCRHGETSHNANSVLQGRLVDPPLNDMGREQASRLGRRLADTTIDTIISSDLKRAQETADFIAGYHPKAARKILTNFAEVSCGDLEGLGTKEPGLMALGKAWLSGNFDYHPPGGESPNAAARRAVRQLFALLQASPIQNDANEPGVRTIAIVSHGVVLRLILSTLLHRSLHMAVTMDHHNCCIDVIDVLASSPTCVFDPLPPLLSSLDKPTLARFSQEHLARQTGPGVVPQDDERLAPQPLVIVSKKPSFGRAWDVDKGQVAC